MSDLAIVIPAYKIDYFDETLSSIAEQTCKDFTLYIGDDHSPDDLKTIVNRFKGKIDIVYKRFDENFGGHDLVAQWTRCIEMSRGEDWIWLFSDDDIMDPNCVERFYSTLKNERPNVDLVRFNVNIINNDHEVLGNSIFPSFTNSEFLFKNKLSGKVNCFAVEFIFSRKIYNEEQGFQNFDLAWGTDIATWMKFGANGIYTIKDAMVSWRSSGKNITTQDSTTIIVRKLKASNAFLIWSKKYWKAHGKNFSFFTNIIFLKGLHGFSTLLPLKKCILLSKDYFKSLLH